jgi:hypothetical protein
VEIFACRKHASNTPGRVFLHLRLSFLLELCMGEDEHDYWYPGDNRDKEPSTPDRIKKLQEHLSKLNKIFFRLGLIFQRLAPQIDDRWTGLAVVNPVLECLDPMDPDDLVRLYADVMDTARSKVRTMNSLESKLRETHRLAKLAGGENVWMLKDPGLSRSQPSPKNENTSPSLDYVEILPIDTPPSPSSLSSAQPTTQPSSDRPGIALAEIAAMLRVNPESFNFSFEDVNKMHHSIWPLLREDMCKFLNQPSH